MSHFGWGPDDPCPKCGLSLKGHWRGRPCLVAVPAAELVYRAEMDAESPEARELARRAEPSGQPYEDTVAGELAREKHAALAAEANDPKALERLERGLRWLFTKETKSDG